MKRDPLDGSISHGDLTAYCSRLLTEQARGPSKGPDHVPLSWEIAEARRRRQQVAAELAGRIMVEGESSAKKAGGKANEPNRR